MKLRCGAVIKHIPSIDLTPTQKELWERWADALESDRYKQTAWRLRSNVGFDCLGVACDIVDPNGWTKCADGYKFQFIDRKGEEIINTEYHLPRTVRLQMGLPNPLGFYVGGTFRDEDGYQVVIRNFALQGLNDIGASFKELAQIIRKAINGGYTYELKAVSMAV